MKQPGCMRRNMTFWLRLRVDDIEVAGWSPRGFIVAAVTELLRNDKVVTRRRMGGKVHQCGRCLPDR